MIRFVKILILSTILLFLFGVGTSLASNGTFWLRSTNENDYKCWAASARMQSGMHKIIMLCENILYPVEGNIFSYVLWANPIDGGAPVRLGAIGLGTGEYSTKVRFASLFITTEKDSKAKAPTGEVVMRGSVRPITFLEEPGDGEQAEETTTPEKKETESPEPTKASVRDRLVVGLKRAGLASGLALIAILGLVFVLTRPK